MWQLMVALLLGPCDARRTAMIGVHPPISGVAEMSKTGEKPASASDIDCGCDDASEPCFNPDTRSCHPTEEARRGRQQCPRGTRKCLDGTQSGRHSNSSSEASRRTREATQEDIRRKREAAQEDIRRKREAAQEEARQKIQRVMQEPNIKSVDLLQMLKEQIASGHLNVDDAIVSEAKAKTDQLQKKEKIEAMVNAIEKKKTYQEKLQTLLTGPSDKLDLFFLELQQADAPPSIFVDSFGVSLDEKEKTTSECSSQVGIFNQELWNKAKPHFRNDFAFTNTAALGENNSQAKALKLISSFQLVGGLMVTAKDQRQTEDPALMLWSCYRTTACNKPILTWKTELKSFSERKAAVIMPDMTVAGEVLHRDDVAQFNKCPEEYLKDFWTRTSIGLVKHQRLIGTSRLYLTSACPPWRFKKTAMYRHEVVALARELGQLSHGTAERWKPDISIYVQRSCPYSDKCTRSSTSLCASDPGIKKFPTFCDQCEMQAKGATPSAECCCWCCQDCQKFTTTLGNRMQGALLPDIVLDIKCYVCDNLRMCAENSASPFVFRLTRGQGIEPSTIAGKPPENAHRLYPAQELEQGAGEAQWFDPRKSSLKGNVVTKTTLKEFVAMKAQKNEWTNVTEELKDELNADQASLEKRDHTRGFCKVGSDWKPASIDHKRGDTIFAILDSTDGDHSQHRAVQCDKWKAPELLQQQLQNQEIQNNERVQECEAEKGKHIFETTEQFCRAECRR